MNSFGSFLSGDLNIFPSDLVRSHLQGDLGMEQVLRWDSNALMRMSRELYSG